MSGKRPLTRNHRNSSRQAPRAVRWSSGFILRRLTVEVVDGNSHALAIGLLSRQERRLKPELQQVANGTWSVPATLTKRELPCARFSLPAKLFKVAARS